ncbi:hypothetical protein [Nonomuraea jabiensis]|uniref:hypothetical protein n=1 Tax=Nonomuraea jabiensis TaxID=882448 RepID=UPI0036C91FB2
MSLGFVLDEIRELGRGDHTVTTLGAELDELAIRTSVPFIALVLAQRTLSDTQIDFIQGMIDRVNHVRLEMSASDEDTASLTTIAAQLGDQPDLGAAHAIAVSRSLDFPILTVDLKYGEPTVAVVPWHIEFFEIREAGWSRGGDLGRGLLQRQAQAQRQRRAAACHIRASDDREEASIIGPGEGRCGIGPFHGLRGLTDAAGKLVGQHIVVA